MTLSQKLAAAVLAVGLGNTAFAQAVNNDNRKLETQTPQVTYVPTPPPRIIRQSASNCWEDKGVFVDTKNCLQTSIVERSEHISDGKSGLKMILNTYAESNFCSSTRGQTSCHTTSVLLGSKNDPQP